MSYDQFKKQGNDCFKAGKYEESLSFYKRCIALDSTNAVGYSNKAMAEIRLGNYEIAASTCEKGLKFADTAEDKVVQKLRYRLDLAKKHLEDALLSEDLLPLDIQEVDELPTEFRSL